MKRAFKISILTFLISGSVWSQPAPVYDIESLQPSVYSDPDPAEEGTVTVVPEPVQVTNPTQVPTNTSADQRLNQIEQQLAALQSIDNHARLDSLQSEVQDLRGQIEKLTHDLTQLQKQKMILAENEKATNQLDQPEPSKEVANEVLDTPVTTDKTDIKIENKVATGPIEKLEINNPKNAQIDVDEEQKIYQSAYNLIKTKNYAEAVQVLQQMLKKYPKGQFASNAHYWLGELFGLQGHTDKALDEFSAIVKNYPKSPRISDAQLKVGLILASQSKWSEAKIELKKVIRHFPGTTSAKTAMDQLKQIKQAGH